jgi:chemotaxis protein CheC
VTTVPEVLGERQLDVLREVGNIGAGTAATALSAMVGGPVDMGIPRVSLVPVEQVPEEVGGGEDVVAAVFLGVVGDAPGHMLVLMREASARALVDTLMGRAGGDVATGDAPFTEMELSALQEVGNVLASAYLGALSALTGLHVEPTPPAVGVDMAGALLGAALAEVALLAPRALLIDSGFDAPGIGSLGEVLYMPTPDALDTVLRSLGLPA